MDNLEAIEQANHASPDTSAREGKPASQSGAGCIWGASGSLGEGGTTDSLPEFTAAKLKGRPVTPLLERLAKSTIIDEATGCWLWVGQLHERGYGILTVKGRRERVHRVRWALHHGAIPDGKVICHRCDVRNCSNIAHLFLGTPLDNVRDMHAKGRAPDRLGSANPQSRLTFDQVRLIKGIGRRQEPKRIAADLGVSISTIHDILKGRTWAHVEVTS